MRKSGETISLKVDDVEQGFLEAKRNMPLTTPLFVGGLPMSVLSTGGFMSDPVSAYRSNNWK